MNIREKLAQIQMEIKAPKDKNNDFGKYKYRSAEQIFESFKKFEDKYKVCLVVEDGLVEVAGRLFIRATATLFDTELNVMDPASFIEVKAYAELDNHKGMSKDQMTGTASSYARKYAMNGLFLLDDTKDADTNEYRVEKDAREAQAEKSAPATKEKAPLGLDPEVAGVDGFVKAMSDKGIPLEFAASFYACEKWEDLNEAQQVACSRNLAKIEKKWKEKQ